MIGILLTPLLVPALLPMWVYFVIAALVLIFLSIWTAMIVHSDSQVFRLEAKSE